MTLSASRIRPGVYEVESPRGVTVSVVQVGSKWMAQDRDNVYTRELDTKRACLDHIEQVDAEHTAAQERRAAEREAQWASMASVHVWIDAGIVGPAELGEIIQAILPGVNTAAWIASSTGPAGRAVLITWRGEEGELDSEMLNAHGGRVVGRGMSPPDEYREV